MTRFLARLRACWRWVTALFTPRRSYPRAACQLCGKTVARTSRGLWPHLCAPDKPDPPEAA